MKFKSEKSAIFALVIFSITAVIFTLLITEILYHSGKNLIMPLLMMLPVGLLLWIWFGTDYEIKDGWLHYRTGPFRGKIEISSIREIRKASVFGIIGIKPALSTNGILICYNKYDEVYISPENKRDFIAELHRYNAAIKLQFETIDENGNSSQNS